MSGKPIHTQVIGLKTPRQRLWEEIRAHADHFTLAPLAYKARMRTDAARDYLRGLKNAGFVEETQRIRKPSQSRNKFAVVYYRLTRDVGVEAPRVTRNGVLVKQGSINEAIWTALRINGEVDCHSLAALASTPEQHISVTTTNSYLQVLARAGYLDTTATAVCGGKGQSARYRLHRHMNTGPKPPQIQRTKRVFDPNLGEVMYQERPELDEERRDGITPIDDRTPVCLTRLGGVR